MSLSRFVAPLNTSTTLHSPFLTVKKRGDTAFTTFAIQPTRRSIWHRANAITVAIIVRENPECDSSEDAGRFVIEAVHRFLCNRSDMQLRQRVYAAIQDANLKLYMLAENSLTPRTLGVSLAVAVLEQHSHTHGVLVVGHVGESQAFLVNQSNVYQLTSETRSLDSLTYASAEIEDPAALFAKELASSRDSDDANAVTYLGLQPNIIPNLGIVNPPLNVRVGRNDILAGTIVESLHLLHRDPIYLASLDEPME